MCRAPTGSRPVQSVDRRRGVSSVTAPGTEPALVVRADGAATDERRSGRTAKRRARRRRIQTLRQHRRRLRRSGRLVQSEDVADEVRGGRAVGRPLSVVVGVPGSRRNFPIRLDGLQVRKESGNRVTATVDGYVDPLLHRRRDRRRGN